jgi:hypothetical protein
LFKIVNLTLSAMKTFCPPSMLFALITPMAWMLAHAGPKGADDFIFSLRWFSAAPGGVISGHFAQRRDEVSARLRIASRKCFGDPDASEHFKVGIYFETRNAAHLTICGEYERARVCLISPKPGIEYNCGPSAFTSGDHDDIAWLKGPKCVSGYLAPLRGRGSCDVFFSARNLFSQ